MSDTIWIDGSFGEGGGQIVRTALALATITGRSCVLANIRAGREKPGLQAQHLAAVRALAQLCRAEVEGDALGSRQLTFTPRAQAQAGTYLFDISALAGVSSVGSATLLLQAIFAPLGLAPGPSIVTLRGGTHVRWSPPYHYLAEVWLPMMERIGLAAQLELGDWGFYPRGGGEISAHLLGGATCATLQPLEIVDRGRLVRLWGFSAASNLPEHVIERQKERLRQQLASRHLRAEIISWAPPSPGPGTAVFLLAEYEQVAVGFSGYGRLRYPAERVADDAFAAFDDHRRSSMALDPYLADQVILPLALAPGASRFTTSRLSAHLRTVAWVAQQFLDREIILSGAEDAPGQVTIH